MKNQRLELTWVGKGEEAAVEPRILLHNAEKDYGDPAANNMLIHGDNLLALKALEQEYAGKIKCIYIDPPYNTGATFEQYDDNLEHSVWLNLMKSRLEILHILLHPEGMIFIQIDDMEYAYLKVLCDEIFGRRNYLNSITIKAKAGAGASGGGEDKRLKKNCEYLLIYVRDYDSVSYNLPLEKIKLSEYIHDHKENKIGFYYTRVLVDFGKKSYIGSIQAGNGEEIKIYRHSDFQFSSVSKLAKLLHLDESEVYFKYFNDIFMVTNAQTSLLKKVNEFVSCKSCLVSYEYIPTTGRQKGQLDTKYVWNETLVVWLRDSAIIEEDIVYKTEKTGTLWSNISWGRLDLEGGISFKSGKKPEALIRKVLDMATNPGDIVLDSFLGSGTTAAVAHKMGRRWIGIELGEHCYTHCKPRLDKVIDGEQGGISKAVNWKGGGGYKFYELAPTLIVQDKHGNPIFSEQYSPEMLVQAVAKICGYHYAPDDKIAWKQAQSQDNSFLFVTTQYFTAAVLDEIAQELGDFEHLLVCAPAFDVGLNQRYENISVRKIPQVVLDKCKYGVDNYNLNIIDPPQIDEEEWDDAE